MSALSLICRRRRVIAAGFNLDTYPWLANWDAAYTGGLIVARDGTGAAAGSGQAVGRILDRGGSNRYLSTIADNARGTRVVGAVSTGLDIVRLDGSDDFYATDNHPSSVETHYFFVGRITSGTGGLFGRGTAFAEWLYKPSSTTLLCGYNTSRGTGSTIAVDVTTLWPTSTVCTLIRMSIRPLATGGANTVELWRDGTRYAAYTTALGTTAISLAVAVGSTYATGGNHAALDLGQMIVAGTMPDADIALAEAALKAKWGTP